MLTLGLLILVQSASAQRITLKGTVHDRESKEAISNVHILDRISSRGATTDTKGFYSFTLRKDSVDLMITHIGYRSKILKLLVRQDTIIDVLLDEGQLLSEVTIEDEKNITKIAQIGSIFIASEQIKRTPILYGEPDPLKVIQLLPGVQAGNEGTNGLYVRGGGPEQNLILLDGIPLYNVSHLYGFVSTFNADMVSSIELLKGGFPARYGGRISSVVDIKTIDGNKERLKGGVSVGLLAARALLEGPLFSEKTTFAASFRRSYLNLLKSPAFQTQPQAVADNYFFYDFNFKIKHIINVRNEVLITAYAGEDYTSYDDSRESSNNDISLKTDERSDLKWGNSVTGIRWNHTFSEKLSFSVSTYYNKYTYHLTTSINTREVQLQTNEVTNNYYGSQYLSEVEDLNGRVDFDYSPNLSHRILIGTGLTNHMFTPGVLATQDVSSTISTDPIQTSEMMAYVEDDYRPNTKVTINVGLNYARSQVHSTTYQFLQPRLSTSCLGLPTDLWVPATERIAPQSAIQSGISISYTRSALEISVEGYHKYMNNLIEYKDGATFLSASVDWQDKLEMGRGETYGIEVFAQRKVGKLKGWIGYTWSVANRQFDNLNNGDWFPFRFDRRHDLKLVLNYNLNKHWSFSANWVFSTGNAITLPVAQFQYASSLFNDLFFLNNQPALDHYPSRNNFRMNPYHRLDIGLTYSIQTRKTKHEINLGTYNTYNRVNPFFTKVTYNFNLSMRSIEQVSLFGVIPSLSYTFKF
jgi:TonB-dependent Receptor Plug Domain/CarboxypepD_reg-like domain/TonB dependent receptor